MSTLFRIILRTFPESFRGPLLSHSEDTYESLMLGQPLISVFSHPSDEFYWKLLLHTLHFWVHDLPFPFHSQQMSQAFHPTETFGTIKTCPSEWNEEQKALLASHSHSSGVMAPGRWTLLPMLTPLQVPMTTSPNPKSSHTTITKINHYNYQNHYYDYKSLQIP